MKTACLVCVIQNIIAISLIAELHFGTESVGEGVVGHPFVDVRCGIADRDDGFREAITEEGGIVEDTNSVGICFCGGQRALLAGIGHDTVDGI